MKPRASGAVALVFLAVALGLAACSSATGTSPSSNHPGGSGSYTTVVAASGGTTATTALGTSTQVGLTLLGEHVLTWYSFQDNTPSNSAMSASGRKLIAYRSVALPFRLLRAFGGNLDYGTPIYVEFLAGRSMPSGKQHDGWVQLDDFCGDNQDDSYCYQTLAGKSYPNIDLWIGDFTLSGMDPEQCAGPAGSGQELTKLYTGTAPNATLDYGGRSIGTGKCGDSTAARAEQSGCWHYTPPAETVSYCADCSSTTCAL